MWRQSGSVGYGIGYHHSDGGNFLWRDGRVAYKKRLVYAPAWPVFSYVFD